MAQRGRGTAAGARPDLGALRSRLRGLVEPIVAREGLDLEDLTVSPAGRRYVVRITVDGDGGVGHDELSDVSREISTGLDEAERTQGELTPDAYTLEVSSPGIDRPLTLPRHWRRNVGRLVKVKVGERLLTGRVTAATEVGISLDGREVAFDELGPGRVQVEFQRLTELSEEEFGELATRTGEPSGELADESIESGDVGDDGDEELEDEA
jgi:ribosome maturation factor RimP